MLDPLSAEALERVDAYIRFQQSHFEILTQWWTFAVPALCLASFVLSVWVWGISSRMKQVPGIRMPISPVMMANVFLCASLTGWFQGCGSSVSKAPFETNPVDGGSFEDGAVTHTSSFIGQSLTLSAPEIKLVKYWPVSFASYSGAKCRVSNLAVAALPSHFVIESSGDSTSALFKALGCFLIEYTNGDKQLVNVRGAASLALDVMKWSELKQLPVAQAFAELTEQAGLEAAALAAVANSPQTYTVTIGTQVAYVYEPSSAGIDSQLSAAVNGLPQPHAPKESKAPSLQAVSAFNSYLALTGDGSVAGAASEDRQDDSVWRRYLGSTKYMIWNGFSNAERKLLWLRFWSLSGVGTPWSLPLAMVNGQVKPLRFFENAVIRDPISPYLAHLSSWRMSNDEEGEPLSHSKWGRAYVWNSSSFVNPKYQSDEEEGSEDFAYEFLYDPVDAEPGDVYQQLLDFLKKGIHFGLEIGMTIVMGEQVDEKYAHQQTGNWNDLYYRSLIYLSNPDQAMAFRERFLKEWKTTVLGFTESQVVSPQEYYDRARTVILEEFTASSTGQAPAWAEGGCGYPVDNPWDCNTALAPFESQGNGVGGFAGYIRKNNGGVGRFKAKLQENMDYAFLRYPEKMIRIVPTSDGGAKILLLTEESRWQNGIIGRVDPTSLYFWLMMRKTVDAFNPAASPSLSFAHQSSVHLDIDSANLSEVVKLQAFVQYLHGQIFENSQSGMIEPGLYGVSEENELDLPVDHTRLGKLRKVPLISGSQQDAVSVQPGERLLPTLLYEAESWENPFQMKKVKGSVSVTNDGAPVRAEFSSDNCSSEEICCGNSFGLTDCNNPLYVCEKMKYGESLEAWDHPDILERFNEFKVRTFRGEPYSEEILSSDGTIVYQQAPSPQEIWSLRKAELQTKISQGALSPSWSSIVNLFSLFEGVYGYAQKAFEMRSPDKVMLVNSNRFVFRADGFRPAMMGGLIGSDLSNPAFVGDISPYEGTNGHYVKGIIPYESGIRPAVFLSGSGETNVGQVFCLDHVGNDPWCVRWDEVSWNRHIELRSNAIFNVAVIHGQSYEETVRKSFSFGNGMPQRKYALGDRGGPNPEFTYMPYLEPHVLTSVAGLTPIVVHFDRFFLSQNQLSRAYKKTSGEVNPSNSDENVLFHGHGGPINWPNSNQTQNAASYQFCSVKGSGSSQNRVCANPTDAFTVPVVSIPSANMLRGSTLRQPPLFANKNLLQTRDVFKRDLYLTSTSLFSYSSNCAGDTPELYCGDPDAGDCNEEHPSPFCNNFSCCTLVCSFYEDCCTTGYGWDEVCVQLAQYVCVLP